MTTVSIGFLAIMAYLGAFICQWANIKRGSFRALALFCMIAALSLHAIQLHQLIDLPTGQNLSWTNLLSLLTWLSGCIIFLANMTLPVLSLNFLLYPVTILSITLSLTLHTDHIFITRSYPSMLVHILLATFVVALLLITGIQASLFFCQQMALKQKKFLQILNILPPLDQMQKLFYFDTWLCFLSLSIFLLSASFEFATTLIHHFLGETIFSLLLWFMFLVVLLERYQRLRWRSSTSILLVIVSLCIAIGLYLSHHQVMQ